MNFDMKDFSAEHQGKRLRIEFTNGEVCDAELLLLCTGDEHANCCGTIFDLHKTNHPEKNQYALQSTPPAAVWSELEFVKSFELLEKEVA
ncbi:MAG: hypothetical protein QOJ41_2958 [Acidobacteriaceae bacterium]|jgi:hypothetical protein|nr:hypothetical protein [Acidobacteriaceae bacterium]